MSDMELKRDDVMVELVDIGEGIDGDFDENNPEDVPLLRFYVNKRIDGQWCEVDSASYCTELPADSDENIQRAALEYLMDQFYEPVAEGQSVKKLAEQLSWINESWLETKVPVH